MAVARDPKNKREMFFDFIFEYEVLIFSRNIKNTIKANFKLNI